MRSNRPIEVVDLARKRSRRAPGRPAPGTDPATGRLLGLAAAAATEAGIDLEGFLNAAVGALLDAQPALRERLAEDELVGYLDHLRAAGRLGSA
jgi:hypothetical protein